MTRAAVLLALALPLAADAQAAPFVPLGGGPTAKGNGGPTRQAPISAQAVIAQGAQLVIADTTNNQIRLDAGGTITALAGTGQAGWDSAEDGRLAVDAMVMGPVDLTVDAVGNYWWVDLNGRLRRRTINGTINTLWVNGMSYPTAVVADGARLLLADSYGYRVIACPLPWLNPALMCNPTTVAGTGTGAYNGENLPAVCAPTQPGCTRANIRPSKLALGADGLYILEGSPQARLRRLGADGLIRTVAGNGATSCSGAACDGPALERPLNNPQGVCISPAGVIAIADFGNRRLRKVAGGQMTTILGNGQQNTDQTYCKTPPCDSLTMRYTPTGCAWTSPTTLAVVSTSEGLGKLDLSGSVPVISPVASTPTQPLQVATLTPVNTATATWPRCPDTPTPYTTPCQ